FAFQTGPDFDRTVAGALPLVRETPARAASESRACSSPGGERPVRSCVTRFLINNATGGNDCAVVRPGGGPRRHRAKDHAAVSSRIGARRICFEFCSAFAGGETQSGHCLLFLFAAAHLSGGSFYFVARFSEKSSADPVARDRTGPDYDDGRSVGGAFAHPVHSMGGRIRAWSNRFAARRSRRDFSDPAASGSPSNSSGPRRRKSGQRCDRTGGASIRSGGADDGYIFVRPGHRPFCHRRARGHRSWSVNRIYRALDPSTPRRSAGANHDFVADAFGRVFTGGAHPCFGNSGGGHGRNLSRLAWTDHPELALSASSLCRLGNGRVPAQRFRFHRHRSPAPENFARAARRIVRRADRLRFVRRQVGRKRDPYPGWRNVAVVAWAGMRGVISLAAAFALPFVLPNGNPFPGRNYILFFTFCVILVTLIFQGLTLPVLIRKLGIKDD